MQDLRSKCFAGWPAESGLPPVTRIFSEESGGILYEAYEIQSQQDTPLRIYVMRKAGSGRPRQLCLRVADSSFTNVAPDEADGLSPVIRQTAGAFGTPAAVNRLIQEMKDQSVAYAVFLPRDIGPTAWSGDAVRQTQLRRRFMLIGQTLDGMRVWDIRRAIQALRSLEGFHETPLNLEAEGTMGVNALYASLFEPGISTLRLTHLPASHMEGPDYLNVLKYLDIPQAAALAADRCPLQLQPEAAKGWDFLRAMAASPAANLKVTWIN